MKTTFFPILENYLSERVEEFDLISDVRKLLLEKVSHYIRYKKEENQAISLVCVCTHNSRRSHFAQIWSKITVIRLNSNLGKKL